MLIIVFCLSIFSMYAIFPPMISTMHFKFNNAHLIANYKSNFLVKLIKSLQFNLNSFKKLQLHSVNIQYAQVFERYSVNIFEGVTNIFDSTFISCHASGDTNTPNGGGIYINTFAVPLSHLNMRHACFHQCSATGSGGAMYASVNSISQTYVFATKCFALTNQAFFEFSPVSVLNYTSISDCGDKITHIPIDFSIGIGGGANSASSNNITRNKLTGDGGIMNVYFFETFNITYCIFSKNRAKTGIYSEDSSYKKMNIIKTHIYGNTFSTSILDVGLEIMFTSSWFEVLDSSLINNGGTDRISFANCNFNAKQEEMEKFISQKQLIDCKYGNLKLPVFSYIPQDCWEKLEEKKDKKRNYANLRIWVLSILAFVCGMCLVSILQFICVKQKTQKNRIAVFNRV